MIFTGIGVLLSVSTFSIALLRRLEYPLSKSTEAVLTSQDVLVDVFGRIENFFRRLETYVQVSPTQGMIDIIVKIMTEVLSILATATREISQNRASKLMAYTNRHLSTGYCLEKYLKKVIEKTDIEDGLARLDWLTQEEVRMAAAQGLNAKTGVKVKLATSAFMMLRTKSPRPLMRFSELRDDVLDVAHVDPVDDTGDRLAQSVPRETLVFRAAAIL